MQCWHNSPDACRPASQPLSVGQDAITYLEVARCGVDGAGYSDLHRLLTTELSLLVRLPRMRRAASGARMSVPLSSPRVSVLSQVSHSL
jgi:hypothetical protein